MFQGLDLGRACGGIGGPWDLIPELQWLQVDPVIFATWTEKQQIDHVYLVLHEYRKLHKLKVKQDFVWSKDDKFLSSNKTSTARKPGSRGSTRNNRTRSLSEGRSRGRGRGRGRGCGRNLSVDSTQNLGKILNQPNVFDEKNERTSPTLKPSDGRHNFITTVCLATLITLQNHNQNHKCLGDQ